ncbi:MAG: imidazole glycerol phosphate synthase subunit HisH [Armatimonadota bacterium]
MIAIIDYGMGNLRSVQKAFEALGAPAQITADPATIRTADAVVLPGVGAFGAAMARLHEAGLVAPLRAIIENGKPFLGICLGLQLLFESSEESPGVEGLGVLRGRVVGFQSHGSFPLPVPHIGWNQLLPVPSCPLWQGMPEQAFVYFVHSFYPEPAEPRLITAWCDYGVRFPCAVQQGNLFAVQFHPEKSGAVGLSILRNFLSIL